MSQRVRRNGSPTSSCLSMPSSETGGGSGGSSGMSVFSRVLPMKATVPFQLKAQMQSSMLTRSVHGTVSGGSSPSPTNNTGNGKFYTSGCSASETPETRTSTSLSRSPTCSVVNNSSSTVVLVSSPATTPLSSLSPSIGYASGAVGHGQAETGTPCSPSARDSPLANTTVSGHSVSASWSNSATSRAAQTISPVALVAGSPPQHLTFPVISPAPYVNIHTYGSSSFSLGIPPVSTADGSPCYSPTQPLPCPLDYPILATALQLQPFSASSPSSSSLSSFGGQQVRAVSLAAPQRWSPGLERNRLSPERVSPSSPHGGKVYIAKLCHERHFIHSPGSFDVLSLPRYIYKKKHSFSCHFNKEVPFS